MKNLSYDFIQKKASDLLSSKAEFALLLGSAATPRFHKESDIDIAVYWKNSDIDFNERLHLVHELEEQLGFPVDLIALNKIDVIYGFQVVETGRLLFCQDPGLLLEWKSEQLSKYPDFKKSRAIIEENILNRKKYV